MNEPIKPALTAEEWERVKAEPGLWVSTLYNAIYAGEDDEGRGFSPSEHGMAAIALNGQPFGFNPLKDRNGYPTPDYVWAIRECADHLERLLKTTPFGMQDDRSIASFAVGFARDAAERILALLPPEDANRIR